MVGSAIVRQLEARGIANLVTRTHKELDLTSQEAVRQFFEQERPEYVILAAARVGGIHANNTYPAEFIHDNLVIATNVIAAAHEASVDRLLFLGSLTLIGRDGVPDDQSPRDESHQFCNSSMNIIVTSFCIITC